jgi:hypothetical protein
LEPEKVREQNTTSRALRRAGGRPGKAARRMIAASGTETPARSRAARLIRQEDRRETPVPAVITAVDDALDHDEHGEPASRDRSSEQTSA